MDNFFKDLQRQGCEAANWALGHLAHGRPVGPLGQEYRVKASFISKDLNATVDLLENLRQGGNPPVWIRNVGQTNIAENGTTKQLEALNRTVAVMIGDEAFDIRKAGRLAELQRFVGLNNIETTKISPDGTPETAKDQLVLGPETAYKLLEKLKRAGTVQLVNKCE
jgi:hypothetical protein